MTTTTKRTYKPRALVPWQERFWVKVDKTSSDKGCWLWTASVIKSGYGMLRVGGTMAYVHRLSYEDLVGPIPEGLKLDHLCHVRHCVNPAHLRPATVKQNNENPAGLRANNTSGYSGVVWQKTNKKWVVRVRHNSKAHYGGVFSDLDAAALAATNLRLALHTYNVIDRNAKL